MKDKERISFGRWFWYCMVIVAALFIVPIFIGGLGLIATVFIPLLLISVPIVVLAFICMVLFP